MSEPIGNTEQLPVAWFYEDNEIKGVSLYKENFCVDAIPLYTHPQRELSEEEITLIAIEFSAGSRILPLQFARAIIKASRGEK